jgi:hypothetical protein
MQLALHTGDFPLKKQNKFTIDCKSVSMIQKKEARGGAVD